MKNCYEVPEVIEIGNARNLIFGSGKFTTLFDDGPGQPKRDGPVEDDE